MCNMGIVALMHGMDDAPHASKLSTVLTERASLCAAYACGVVRLLYHMERGIALSHVHCWQLQLVAVSCVPMIAENAMHGQQDAHVRWLQDT
jgi:hypothetical protein